MTNLEIAELLRDVAASYQLRDDAKNKFKTIAYNRAADSVEHATSEIKDLWDEGKLDEIPGIGPNIARHLDELFRTGKSKHFSKIMKGIPKKAFKLMKLPGIGIKTALQLIAQGNQGEIKKMLGQVSKKSKEKRLLLPYAKEIADSTVEWLVKEPSALRVEPLGSLRRKVATVGDIDIAVATNEPGTVIEHFSKYPKAKGIIEKGESSASILLPGEVQVDLKVVKPKLFGSLLQHFTGSKHHNIALREYALKIGMSLSEYGIKRVNAKKVNAKLKTFRTEEEFYRFIGLDWIPPELREDSGEIEVFAKNRDGEHSRTMKPKLVELKEIKADLQIHSSFDIETSHDLGISSMEEIIKKANKLGYEYIAFTEHNPSKSKHIPEDIVEILKRKRENVEQLNYSSSLSAGRRIIKVFNSLEIDIMPDGKLPISEEGLDILDFALVAVHSSFNLNEQEMTKRIINGLSHPKVKILAHPTARRLNEREGVELDWPKIFEFCKNNNKWLEINADPIRLDLPDFLVREAVKEGVKMTLGTDSHHVDMMDNMEYGVAVARRGWAEKCDIINTLSLDEFEKEVMKK